MSMKARLSSSLLGALAGAFLVVAAERRLLGPAFAPWWLVLACTPLGMCLTAAWKRRRSRRDG